MSDTARKDTTSKDTTSKDTTSKDLVQKQFGAHAAAYATSKVHAQGASLARLVALVQPQPTWEVLDIATAAGHTAWAFAPHVAHVHATDLTAEMLPVAAQVAADKGITNVTLQLADAEALPFPDASFDLVTCRIAPHHFPHIDRFLAEAKRVLRAHGTLAVVDNVVPEDAEAGAYVNAFEKLRDPSHGRALSVAEWLAAMTAAGFAVVHHEVAAKSMEFMPWAERMGASAAVIAELRRLLLDAPPAAAAFFRTETVGDDLLFNLDEAILIGRA
jgi:ubiquinone/menaquinone biosynthesis C-methylase UbiE